MPPVIRIEHLHHTYSPESKAPVVALRDVNLTIEQGEYVVILGHNGCGKSTLAKHLNALLLPSQGNVWINQWNTREKQQIPMIRATVGMVFQNPDNQIVATIVEEDVAFGPENLGVPHDELLHRVDWALDQVEMQPYRQRAPHLLSGGQKQRVCIAGVLAMQPQVLVLDEATAMLDPLGRQEVLATVQRLHREQGVTVVAITHFMHEALAADRVIVMHQGEIVLEGTPRELFRQVEKLRALQLDVPPVTALAHQLAERLPNFPTDVLTVDELVAAIVNCQLSVVNCQLTASPIVAVPSEVLIDCQQLVHYYMRGTPLQVKALHGVTLDVRRGEIVGLIGHTGSGKSTVVQHFNGLLRPHEGSLTVLGQNLSDPKLALRELRQQVGLVFQFAEAQLFEQYVGDDIAYGPRNLKLNREQVRAHVRRAMSAVGLGFEEFKDRLTFSLSGGQMRRVALAGVLALEPTVLVLDEPTAGLDPQGRKQLLAHILALHQQGITLVIISHNMDELAEICDRLYVLAAGRTVLSGTPSEIFGQAEQLHELGLATPAVTQVIDRLRAKNILPPGETIYTVAGALQLLTGSR